MHSTKFVGTSRTVNREILNDSFNEFFSKWVSSDGFFEIDRNLTLASKKSGPKKKQRQHEEEEIVDRNKKKKMNSLPGSRSRLKFN